MNVTVVSKEEGRIQVEIEMKNTMLEDEKYCVVFVEFNGRMIETVYVQRKNGKYAELNPQKHRYQFNRVAEIARKAL